MESDSPLGTHRQRSQVAIANARRICLRLASAARVAGCSGPRIRPASTTAWRW